MFSMEKIGKNIASLRKKDITQMGLADQLGISYQAISKRSNQTYRARWFDYLSSLE